MVFELICYKEDPRDTGLTALMYSKRQIAGSLHSARSTRQYPAFMKDRLIPLHREIDYDTLRLLIKKLGTGGMLDKIVNRPGRNEAFDNKRRACTKANKRNLRGAVHHWI
jgi:hypothetical protein